MNASKRLEAAKSGKATAIREIAEAENLRRETLIKGNERAAAAADRLLIELRMALKRREDEIELLREPLQREQQDARFPPDIAAARALLQKHDERLAVLRARHPHRFEASTAQERDTLPGEIERLQNHIQLLERMHG
jgi:hypothetical protein